jgi:hypothetical protein
VREITRSRREYRRYVFNDEKRLKSRIRPGDVVLVDGDQRVSQAIKYMTNVALVAQRDVRRERFDARPGESERRSPSVRA